MRKSLILTLVFLSFVKTFACSCANQNFAQVYLESEIVAIVTIGNTYNNKEYEKNGMQLRSYSADLKFEKIYKGKEFKTLNVLGTTTYAYSGACEKLVGNGEKYLVMLTKNNEGEYFVSACSTMPRINSETIDDYEKIFTIIEKNKNKILFKRFADYEDNSRKYDGITQKLTSDFTKLKANFKKKIGIYSVMIDTEGKVEKVVSIEKIGKKEKKIQELIKENFTIYDGFDTRKGEYLILLKL